jgi:hypothetical protein
MSLTKDLGYVADMRAPLVKYRSAWGWLVTSAHKTERLGSSVQLSSELLSSLLPPSDHVLVRGSKIAVRVELMSPSSTLPSGRKHGPVDAPLFYASAVLKDGRVFVAGGEYNAGNQVDLLLLNSAIR